MDYGRQYPIAQLYWLPRSDNVGIPVALKLEYSIDGKTYYEITQNDLIDENSLAGFDADFKTKYIRFKEPKNARFIRVTILQTAYSPLAGMS